ncbi:hypothetical protein NI382_02960 [Vibrio parahaemolyticus]|nr:hypothetical protein NI382_02960 [Vibrio parahaemolyticus]
MSIAIKKQIDLLEHATSGNDMAKVVLSRILGLYGKCFEKINSSDLVDLAALSDTELAAEVGLKIAEMSVFSDVEETNSLKERTEGELYFLNLLSNHESGLDTKQVAKVLGGISTAAVGKQRKNGQIFYLKVAGKYYHPCFQFNEENVITDSFKRVIKILSSKDQMASLEFLISEMETFDGSVKSIYEILRGESQPRFTYEQIEKLANRIDDLTK